RMRFVVALGRDQSLREHVLALEQLAIDAANLPRPLVPEGFAARVLERTTPLVESAFRRIGPWRRLLDAMWAPRALQWNLAGAAAAACVVLLAVGAAIVTGMRRPETSIADATPAAAAPASGPVLVRL